MGKAELEQEKVEAKRDAAVNDLKEHLKAKYKYANYALKDVPSKYGNFDDMLKETDLIKILKSMDWINDPKSKRIFARLVGSDEGTTFKYSDFSDLVNSFDQKRGDGEQPSRTQMKFAVTDFTTYLMRHYTSVIDCLDDIAHEDGDFLDEPEFLKLMLGLQYNNKERETIFVFEHLKPNRLGTIRFGAFIDFVRAIDDKQVKRKERKEMH